MKTKSQIELLRETLFKVKNGIKTNRQEKRNIFRKLRNNNRALTKGRKSYRSVNFIK